MFYAFSHTILTTEISTAPYQLNMELAAGIVHQVDVLFQDGCDHKANVQIFQANYQAWPTNRGSAIRGNATVVSFREFYELKPGLSILTAKIWGDGVIENVEVIIQIGLLPKRIIQPMAFEELLAAAAGIE